MPIYEYQCQSCGHAFDAIQKFSDEPLSTCPECQKETLRKLISAPSFQLKGSGWYETDFKDKKKQAMFDKMQKAARKGIKFTSKDVTPKGFGPDEGIEEQKKPSMQALFVLIADTKNAQEGIAKIMKALKVDEKKASRIMDKIIAAALKAEELGDAARTAELNNFENLTLQSKSESEESDAVR